MYVSLCALESNEIIYGNDQGANVLEIRDCGIPLDFSEFFKGEKNPLPILLGQEGMKVPAIVCAALVTDITDKS